MNIKRILIPLLLIILMASMAVFGASVPIGPNFNDGVMEYGNDGLTIKSSGITHLLLAPDAITGLTEVTSTDLDMMIIADQSDSWALKKVDMGEVRGGGGSTFVALTDTPANYTGSAGKYAKVNAGETALEFATGGAGETNTASNIGANIEIYKQKTGVNLELRTLKANSNQISVSTTPVGGEIDVGLAATDRNSTTNANHTHINKGNPANQTGTITSVEIWANTNMEGVIVATFYVVAGNNLTARDSEALANITAGSKVTRAVTLDVHAGDYIGIYKSAGTVELSTTSEDGNWQLEGDHTSCSDTTFYLDATRGMSLYGTGVTSALDYIKFDVEEGNIKLDDLGTPDDNTDLNASTSAHGLLPKLPNVATQFLDGTGAWAILAAGDIPDLSATYQAFDNALASISGLAYVSPSFIKLTANDSYAVRTISETKTDLSLNNVTNDAQIAKSIGTAQSDIIYFTGSATPTVLPKGTATQVLAMNAGATAPEWTAAGAGDVSKVGTPADSQVGVWTGDGTIEGTADLTYDSANLQLTGDIGSTGTRITKGWFEDLTVTNAIAGGVTGNAATATALATGRTIGGVSFDGTANIVPTTIAVTDESADTECFVGYFTGATGDLLPKTGTNLTFNSSSGVLTATGFAGALTGNVTGDVSGSSGSCTGNAATCTTASAGDAAVDFFGAGVDAVTDATTCTDLEGTLLSIGGTTLNAAIPADHITYDMMQDVTATDKILGRSTAGAGTVEEIACTAAGRAILDDADAATQRATLGAAASGANTDITSILNAALYVGRDADNQIKFATDNKIVFRVNAADKAEMISSGELDMNAGSVGFTLQSTTGDGTTTIDWKLGNKFKFTFGAQNETFTFTAPTNPCTLMLTIIQDGTGSRTITWPATVKWPGGTEATLTTTANARDKVALDWDGTQYDAVCTKDFK